MLHRLIEFAKSSIYKLMNLPELKNESGLSADAIKLLAGDLRRLESIDPELPDRIVKFIVDNQEPDFPLAFAGILASAGYSGQTFDFYYDTTYSAFFRKYNSSDAAPLFRLAQIYGEIGNNRTLAPHFYSRSQLKFAAVDLSAFVSILIYVSQRQTEKFSIDLTEQIFARAGGEIETLARLIFIPDPNAPGYETDWIRREIVKFEGFAKFVARRAAIVREALNSPKAEQKLVALNILDEQNIEPQQFAPELAPLACASSKSVRNAATVLLKKCQPETVLPLLRAVAETGAPNERSNAVKLLFESEGAAAIEFLKNRLAIEKSAAVRETIDELINGKNAQTSVAEDYDLTAPLAPPAVETDAPLGEETLNALRQAVKSVEKASFDYYETNKDKGWRLSKPQPIGDRKLDKMCELLQRGAGEVCRKFGWAAHNFNYYNSQAPLLQVFKAPEVKPVHLVRLGLLLEHHNLIWFLNQNLPLFSQNPNFKFGLRELDAILRALNIGDEIVTEALFRHNRYYSPLDNFIKTDQDIWQFLFDKQDEIERALLDNNSDKRQNALVYLSKFPQIPPRFRQKLWEFALGKTKAERALAQKCLDKTAGKIGKLLAALKNRSADVRAIAAEWLGNSGDQSAIEPLHAAIKIEKSDAAIDQMLRALERLGASVEEYLDRDKLRETALNELKTGAATKIVPWLNQDSLPRVRWADTKEAVAPEILQFFIVQAAKQKQIEPSPLLRRYFDKFEPKSREKFGQFALESWLAADTRPFAPDEAEQKAKALLAGAQTYWQYYQTQGLTPDSYFQQEFNRLLKTPRGSAIKEKGVLAIAAACCGAAAVAPVERYIREFHGHRLKQSQALVEVLGEMNDLGATQVLLSLANRFRTKGIQESAQKQVDALAARNNWTLDELADRTIPTLGFDDKGELKLDYGARSFKAKLDKDFNFVLFDETNKKIKSLPAARKEDDHELVKDAKQTFQNAKKNLKSVLTLQRERLHEAMCSRRAWTFADWQTFLNGHPILRRYCQTLVWQTLDDENAITFRPLDDNSLTDFDDNEIEIEANAKVRLAHEQTVSKTDSKKWQEHLSDYEVAPVFEQFNRPMPELSEADLNKTELKDFEGFMIETFKLRGKTTALGYKRGQAEDAGWFYYYKKSFPALELDAFVEFTGNGLPEENRSVALLALSFAKSNQQTSGYLSPNSGLRIKDVPPVVLCETWNEMHAIAAAGTGFHADWKKKSEY